LLDGGWILTCFPFSLYGWYRAATRMGYEQTFAHFTTSGDDICLAQQPFDLPSGDRAFAYFRRIAHTTTCFDTSPFYSSLLHWWLAPHTTTLRHRPLRTPPACHGLTTINMTCFTLPPAPGPVPGQCLQPWFYPACSSYVTTPLVGAHLPTYHARFSPRTHLSLSLMVGMRHRLPTHR